jgi:predicted ArsR family transcriptional regulator
MSVPQTPPGPGTGQDRPGAPEHDLAALALLTDPSRRTLYDLVRRSSGPVTREAATGHAGISVRLAAFHLDKLVAGGLLRARTDRPAGTGRLGRRPKVYEPTDLEVTVSLPPRQYDFLAEILLDAIEGSRAGARDIVIDAGRHAAHARGVNLGVTARAGLRGPRLGAERALTTAAQVLDGYGFEPARVSPDRVVLRNCPLHRLAERSRDLVCGLNHAFCSGVLDGLDAATAVAELSPAPGACCVILQAAGPRGDQRDQEGAPVTSAGSRTTGVRPAVAPP